MVLQRWCVVLKDVAGAVPSLGCRDVQGPVAVCGTPFLIILRFNIILEVPFMGHPSENYPKCHFQFGILTKNATFNLATGM